ncbi:MAG: hypothetical protein AAB472_01880 [Patescibacteria group bacterium]
MSTEGFRNKTSDADAVAEAREQADPTTYSALPSELEDGAWHKLNPNKTPALQQAAVRLLKGLIHVSDVIEKDGEFYSKEMAHESIAEKMSEDDIQADAELINLILNDVDHIYNTDAVLPTHNVKVEKGTASFHDFEADMESVPHRMHRNLNERARARFDRKLEQVQERFASPEGEVLARSIFDDMMKHEPKSFEGSFDAFYGLLKTRIEKAGQLSLEQKELLDTYGK